VIKPKFTNKRLVIAAAIIAAGLLSLATVASVASAQQAEDMQNGMPQINGSVNVREQMGKFIDENLKVSFTAAADTAQQQVTDGKVVSGHLGVVQGYLVYTFFVVNTDTNTGKMVIVDAGNGSVLHTSDEFQLGEGFMHEGFKHGYGKGFGHWGAGHFRHW
jgi:uncharacterized membrane protein YkoI